MPLYEYYCADCRTKFELLSPFSRADKDVVCQQCHSTKVRRLLSVFAAHRGGDGEFGDGYHFSGPDDGCACGGNCACGGLEN
ncbi:MAG TPA: zinc ribbon domain-containing protein [Ktedonobacterales bacterium]|jgi:putative FmdB family regulatory protein|nr:zinc ribbon domain-containing protein [Ktedonobacterales bacterium]